MVTWQLFAICFSMLGVEQTSRRCKAEWQLVSEIEGSPHGLGTPALTGHMLTIDCPDSLLSSNPGKKRGTQSCTNTAMLEWPQGATLRLHMAVTGYGINKVNGQAAHLYTLVSIAPVPIAIRTKMKGNRMETTPIMATGSCGQTACNSAFFAQIPMFVSSNAKTLPSHCKQHNGGLRCLPT